MDSLPHFSSSRNSLPLRSSYQSRAASRIRSRFAPSEALVTREEMNAAEEGVFVHKAPQGTGKTQNAARLSQACETVVVITPTRGLAADAAQVFQIAHYMDTEIAESSPKLAVCAPSLRNTKYSVLGKAQIDLLVIDEVNTLHETLVGLGTAPIESIECLKVLLSTSRKVLCLDAGASDETLKTLRKLVHRPIAICDESELLSIRKKQVNFFLNGADGDSSYNIYKNIDEDLKARRKIAVACETLPQVETLTNWIVGQNFGYRVAVVTSENYLTPFSVSPRDIVRETHNYDAVIYTSAIGTGVSITDPDFQKLHVFYSGQTLSPEKMHQMLGRFRNVNSIDIRIAQNRIPRLENEYEMPDFNFVSAIEGDCEYASEKMEAHRNYIRARHINDRIYATDQLEFLLRDEGHQIEFIAETTYKKGQVTRELKKRVPIAKALIQDILTRVPTITWKLYKPLHAWSELNRVHIPRALRDAVVQKYEILSALGIDKIEKHDVGAWQIEINERLREPGIALLNQKYWLRKRSGEAQKLFDLIEGNLKKPISKEFQVLLKETAASFCDRKLTTTSTCYEFLRDLGYVLNIRQAAGNVRTCYLHAPYARMSYMPIVCDENRSAELTIESVGTMQELQTFAVEPYSPIPVSKRIVRKPSTFMGVERRPRFGDVSYIYSAPTVLEILTPTNDDQGAFETKRSEVEAQGFCVRDLRSLPSDHEEDVQPAASLAPPHDQAGFSLREGKEHLSERSEDAHFKLTEWLQLHYPTLRFAARRASSYLSAVAERSEATLKQQKNEETQLLTLFIRWWLLTERSDVKKRKRNSLRLGWRPSEARISASPTSMLEPKAPPTTSKNKEADPVLLVSDSPQPTRVRAPFPTLGWKVPGIGSYPTQRLSASPRLRLGLVRAIHSLVDPLDMPEVEEVLGLPAERDVPLELVQRKTWLREQRYVRFQRPIPRTLSDYATARQRLQAIARLWLRLMPNRRSVFELVEMIRLQV